MHPFQCQRCDQPIPNGREMEALSIGFEYFRDDGEIASLESQSTHYCVTCMPSRVDVNLSDWSKKAPDLQQRSVGDSSVSFHCFECGAPFCSRQPILSVCLIREFFDSDTQQLVPLSADWLYACCLECIPNSKRLRLPCVEG